MENIKGPGSGKYIVFYSCGGEMMDAGLLTAVGEHLNTMPVRINRGGNIQGMDTEEYMILEARNKDCRTGTREDVKKH